MTGAAVLVVTGAAGSVTSVPPVWSRPVAGVPFVSRAVGALVGSSLCARVIVLVPGPEVEATRRLLAHDPDVVSVYPAELGVPVGLTGTVAVHEMTRPLAPVRLLSAVLAAAGELDDVVVPVLPVSDTIKRVDPDGRVLATEDRAGLRRVQTPVGLPARLLAGAAPADLTDAVALLAYLSTGRVLRTVPGDPMAFAARGEWDLRVAESLLRT